MTCIGFLLASRVASWLFIKSKKYLKIMCWSLDFVVCNLLKSLVFASRIASCVSSCVLRQLHKIMMSDTMSIFRIFNCIWCNSIILTTCIIITILRMCHGSFFRPHLKVSHFISLDTSIMDIRFITCDKIDCRSFLYCGTYDFNWI